MRNVWMAVFFALGSLTSCKSQTVKQMSNLLIGEWASYKDPKYVMIFSGSSAVEKYVDNEEESRFDYQVTDKNCGIDYDLCTRNCFYLVKKESGDEAQEYCYLIKALTPNTLTLVYEGGRVMDFKKKQ